MNFRSHFSAVAFALFSTACTNNAEISIVRREAYVSDPCWLDQRGNLVAFLALARSDRSAVPYLISAKCLVSGYSSYGEAMIEVLNTTRIVDSHGALQRAFPNTTILNNVSTDLPLPSSESDLYFFRARFTVVPDAHGMVIYAPRDVLELTKVNLSFDEFLGLSESQRAGLLGQYYQGPGS
jgi:hypothetical protein